jgi:hypothetical protein
MGPSKFNNSERRCCCCGKSFKPHVRLKNRQKTCGHSQCKAKRRHQTLQTWRRINPGYQKKRYYPDGFWKEYRKKNLLSSERNWQQAKLRARLKRKSLQRNLDILQAAESPKQSKAFTGFATLHRSPILNAFGKDDSS